MINNEVLAVVFIVLLVILACFAVGVIITIVYKLLELFVKWVEDRL